MRFGVSVKLNWLCLSCVLLERIIRFNLVFGVQRPATKLEIVIDSLERLIKDTNLGQERFCSFMF